MEQFGFVLITSFLLYYLVFIFIPAIGPQFYFSYPDNFVEAKGLFGHLVKLIQENGEATDSCLPKLTCGCSIDLYDLAVEKCKKICLLFPS